MSDLSGVTAATLRAGIMRGIIGPGARFENVPDLDDALDEAILDAEASVEADLSTKLAVTTFQGWMGPGAPTGFGPDVVVEGPYDWPPQIPGDNFPRFRTRCRPVVSLEGLTIIMPGGIQTRVDIPIDWARVYHDQGEIMVAPSLFSAPLQSGGMTGPLILGLANRQLPMSVLISYTAGLGPAGLKKWPQVRRLAELRSMVRALPQLSVLANPEVLTSMAADGLSQSRASGYVYKDLEDRLEKEADALLDRILSLWDGPGSMMVL